MKLLSRLAPRGTVALASVLILACGSDNTITPPHGSAALATLGEGIVAERNTAEIYVRGNYAYTTTWGFRQAPGNAVKIWNVAGDTPILIDSVIVEIGKTK